MTKKAAFKKKASAKKSASAEEKEKKRPAHLFKPGQSGNPNGRGKGSRNKFAEQFFKDFLEDWEENGVSAIKACRKKKPAEYVKIGASLLPKDFNINMNNKAELEKLVEGMNDADLDNFIRGLTALGASTAGEASTSAPKARSKPDSVH